MKFLALTATTAIFTQQVNAHGYLSQPAATFKPNVMNTNYVGIITEAADPAFTGKKWNDNPVANTKMFTDTFPNSKYKSLREMMDQFVPDCGNTVTTGSPVDVSSLSSMKWQNDQEKMGFIESHHGPCEAYIDDVLVAQSDDCRADYTAYPAEIPIDFSKCSGSCTFTFYWLAMHEPNWQVYKNCVPIQNGSGGGSSTTTAPATTTAAPATTSAAPAATTAAPSTGGDDEYDSSASSTGGDDEYDTSAPSTGGDGEYDDEYDTPAPTTTAPTTSAPSPAGTVKPVCNRLRRNRRN